MVLLTKKQALQAVETACNQILTDDLGIEGKLLMFDNFSISLATWVSANLIDYDWLNELLNYVNDVKQMYRRSLKKEGK